MSYLQDYTELMNLTELAGIHVTPNVYKILIELLSLQVSPEDVYILLKQISLPDQKKRISNTSKPNSGQ